MIAMLLPIRASTRKLTPLPETTQTGSSASGQDQPRPLHENLEAAMHGLQQRELLEPVLLLSAGYLALPFLLRQGFLLLAPLLALWGVVPEREKKSHALPE